MGKNIVREHSFDFNAQEVFRKIVKHYTESASAKISSSTTLGYLTTAKYGSSWTGTAEGFILHWKNHLRIYNDTVPTGEQLPQQLCLSLLENAVHDVPELRQVKITATLDLAKGGSPISYDSYLSLLLASASLYDNGNNLSNSRSGKNKRNIYTTELAYHPTDFESEPDVDYDIDVSPTAIYEANAHVRNNSTRNRPLATNRERPYIPREMWNLLSDDSKAILQGLAAPGKQAPLNGSPPHQTLQANTHETIGTEHTATDTFHDCAPETELLAHLTERVSRMSSGDIRKVLAASRDVSEKPKSLQSNVLQYQVSRHTTNETSASLVDRGANGGLAGGDVIVLLKTGRSANITGINDHTLPNLDIVTAAGCVESQNGPIILIMNQYAHLGKGKTIHSSAQLEHYRNHVEDRSRTVGGNQRIVTLDDYIIPLHIRQGLPYMDMRRPTDAELASLPHVVLTSDVDWDPSVLDNEIDLATSWYDGIHDLPQPPYVEPRFDHTGQYLHRHISLCDYRDDAIARIMQCQQHHVTRNVHDYEALRPCFGWVSADTVRKTIMATTQHAREVYHAPLRKHFKSRFPALNVHRRNEPVATDTIWSDTPAVDNGAKFAQLFVGRRSLVTDAYPMKTDKEFVNTLEDHIRFRGAMDKLISDRAQVEISKKVTDITRAYNIDQWQSEPNHQHQNFAERRIATIEANTNNILNLTGAPDNTWLLCVTYVCYVFNHLAHESLDHRTPLEVLTGSTPDISVLLQFHFWEPVYYRIEDATFPSGGTEQQGHFVGIADSVGDALTYKILNDRTNRILYRSSVRSAAISGQTNLRLASQDGENGPKPINFIKSRRTENQNSYAIKELPGFTPDDLIGRTFLTDTRDDGERFRARITRKILDPDKPSDVTFLVEINDGEHDEILTYNEILDKIETDLEKELHDTDRQWSFKDIVAHEGPLLPRDKNYKGSRFNVLVNWETGESTYEPLDVIGADDPVTCAIYAKSQGLLDTPGWKQFKRFAARDKQVQRLVSQALQHSSQTTSAHKFGYQLPRNHKDAIAIDMSNGNSKWQDAESTERAQLHEYDTFVDYGKANIVGNHVTNAPKGYKKIRVHTVYDVKHDGRHKARMVAGGHLTPIPIESVYSGVVSLRSLRIVVFLAELNGLKLWGADIGNAYLEANTKEKVFIVAGPEFAELEGHVLVINKALYGLRSSGLRWHERFADTLRGLGFTASKADSDVWMREKSNVYEYIAVYVDDIAVAAHDPGAIIHLLKEKYKYKLKGVGPLEYHLGCTFERDKDGTLSYHPKKYISRMMEQYERMFQEQPKQYVSPLEKGDHPELDSTPELGDAGIKQYQSLIGSLQWLITLGRFDIATAVMSMSRFRVAPRQGHLDRLKRMYGYVKKMKSGAIRVRTDEPDYSGLPDNPRDWATSVYGNVKELLPHDAPTALGKHVRLTSYVDANLYHDMATGRSVTGVLHLINQTPFEWYSKRQATVETATYGSEFVAARIAVEQILDIRTTLRFLGVPIIGKSILFGDNQSVIISSTEPQSPINKRHNALSYHRVREAIAAGIVDFQKVVSAENVADILSKHWGFQQAWPVLKPMLFWQGDPSKCEVKASNSSKQADGECHDIHQGDMSLGQSSSKGDVGSVNEDGDNGGIVVFMSALLYDPLYSRHHRGCPVLEVAGAGYKNGD
jgi:hypothetical protein